MDFKIDSTKKCNVILCTSSIKSEGKTVSAVNIASSYVAAGRKVLLIGADLRNPQLHNVLNVDRNTTNIGLSNLIVDPAISTNKNLIQSFDAFNYKLDVLFSGNIPPNPAELLNSDRFVNILHSYKSSYDYIIIDSAPLLLVSDTYPLLKNCDLTVFTTRSGFTDKKIIAFINGLVEDKKVDNIALILNAVKLGPKSYYKYGYSYRYSYQYKYNYGYGYGYGEDKS
jgi:capsular exopolysaccharide synthesis family protein